MPLAQLADPWQKMPVGGTTGEVRASVTPDSFALAQDAKSVIATGRRYEKQC